MRNDSPKRHWEYEVFMLLYYKDVNKAITCAYASNFKRDKGQHLKYLQCILYTRKNTE